MREAHPYESLDPDAVLNAVEWAGFQCDGRLLALNSYENRVYQVGVEDASPVIAKFYRPGRWTNEQIIEEHLFSAELQNLDIPVVGPLPLNDGETLHEHGGFRFAVFERRQGRWPELDSAEHKALIGRLLGRMHAVGALRQFEHRPELNVDTHGWQALKALRVSDCIPPDMLGNVVAGAEALLGAVEVRMAEAYPNLQRIHGDFHLGNVLWAQGGPNVVDLDDCCTGPAIQDLWMLLSGDLDQRTGQFTEVLRGYSEFCHFDQRELALIEPLRGLRMVRYAGWIAQRWTDPAFERAFPWFTTPRYWEEQIIGFREQLMVLDEPPLYLL